jgi:predicted ATPase
LGYADQAQQWSQEALALASQVGHTPTLGFAHFYAARLAHCRRDVTATQAHAEALMAFAAEQGFALRLEQGRILQGWALAMQGVAFEAVAQIRQGWAVYPGVGPKLMQPYFLSLLAEVYGQAGQPEDGLQAVVEALTLVETTEERWWEAELSRLRGTLLLQLPTPDVDQAEACFQQALTVACGQQARSLELRATMSLSRLWQQQGKQEAAHDLLSPIYSWFTEGLDTADLQDAKEMLEELS